MIGLLGNRKMYHKYIILQFIPSFYYPGFFFFIIGDLHNYIHFYFRVDFILGISYINDWKVILM